MLHKSIGISKTLLHNCYKCVNIIVQGYEIYLLYDISFFLHMFNLLKNGQQ